MQVKREQIEPMTSKSKTTIGGMVPKKTNLKAKSFVAAQNAFSVVIRRRNCFPQKPCSVTSLGVVPCSRKVLLHLFVDTRNKERLLAVVVNKDFVKVLFVSLVCLAPIHP